MILSKASADSRVLPHTGFSGFDDTDESGFK